MSSVPRVIGNIVDCGAGAPGTSRDPAGLVASEYLRTSQQSNPESGCARSLSVAPARNVASPISKKALQLTSPGASGLPITSAISKWPPINGLSSGRAPDWNDSRRFRRLAARYHGFEEIKLRFILDD